MIEKILTFLLSPKPWTKVLVAGYIDVFLPPEKPGRTNFDSLLYAPKELEGVDPQKWGERVRDRFANPEEMPLVLRPDWNGEPRLYVRIPEGYWPYLRPGDWVEAKAKPALDTEDRWCLGDITDIRTVNGGPLPSTDRPSWLTQPAEDRLRIGEPPFEGKLASLLRVTHCLPGRGDRFSVISPAQAGKSTFLANLLAEVKPDVRTIVITSERPEEVGDFQAAARPDTEFFVALEGTSPLRRLHNVELGLHRAMRLAEGGNDVVVIFDSLTKGVADPVNSLPAPEGVGIEPGGINPLTKDIVTVVLNVGGRYRLGSITIVTSVLNEGDIQSLALRSKCRRSGTGEITLNSQLALAGVFPALEFSLEEIKSRGGTIFWRNTNARRFADWAPQELHRAALSLQDKLTFQTCLREVLEEEQKRLREEGGHGVPRELAELRAWELAAGRLARLIQLVERGVDDATIFHQFGVAFGEPAAPAPTPPSVGEEAEEVRPEPAPAPTPPLRPAISDEKIAEMAKAFFFGEAEEE